MHILPPPVDYFQQYYALIMWAMVALTIIVSTIIFKIGIGKGDIRLLVSYFPVILQIITLSMLLKPFEKHIARGQAGDSVILAFFIVAIGWLIYAEYRLAKFVPEGSSEN